MTDGTSQPMVFGDIHELLRKVNGESEPAYMWQSDKPKEEVKQEEPFPAEEKQSQKDDKEKCPSTEDSETDNEPSIETEPCQKEKPRKSRVKPPPAKPEREEERKAAENVKEIPKAKISALPSKKDIQSQIESFSYAMEKGHRHWVFLPDEVCVTLEIVYGRNRLSAIFTALAKAFIDANKDELRRLITHRTHLLQ